LLSTLTASKASSCPAPFGPTFRTVASPDSTCASAATAGRGLDGGQADRRRPTGGRNRQRPSPAPIVREKRSHRRHLLMNPSTRHHSLRSWTSGIVSARPPTVAWETGTVAADRLATRRLERLAPVGRASVVQRVALIAARRFFRWRTRMQRRE
jgi:hypothetical protein